MPNQNKDQISIDQTDEYLTFKFGNETFALEITNVKEVINFTKITKVPRLPDHLSGVINLRGCIVSIIDVRIKLGIDIMETSSDTCIIVVEIQDKEEFLQTGILVDSLKEVIHLSKDHQIAPPPRVGIKLNKDYLKGVGMKHDKPVLILDIEKILEDDKLEKNSY